MCRYWSLGGLGSYRVLGVMECVRGIDEVLWNNRYLDFEFGVFFEIEILCFGFVFYINSSIINYR